MKKILYVATDTNAGMLPFVVTTINAMAESSNAEVMAVLVETERLKYKGKISRLVDATYVDERETKYHKIIDKIIPYKIIREINRKKKEFNPDVIHFLSGDYRMALYIVLMASKKMYYTVHDLVPHDRRYHSTREFIMSKLINLGYWLNCHVSPNINTCSLSQYERLKDKFNKKNIFLTPFPTLVTDQITSGEKECTEVKGVDRYILFFGNIVKYKGVECLIDAYAKANIVNTPLVIAGRGTIECKLPSNVIWINRFIDDTELSCLFQRANVIVYPYLSITMSGVLSLAFYFKKKVILSDLPFFRQYKCDETFFFEAGCSDQLKTLLASSILTKSGVYNNYDSFFSNKSLVKSLLCFYDNMSY